MKRKIISVLLAGIIVITAAGTVPVCAQETESGNEQGMTEDSRPVGIISAMSNEIALLLNNAKIDHVDQIGGQDFHVGELFGRDVVIVEAGIGKVRAASGAATLLNTFDPSSVIFTGIAGGAGDETKVLDVVIATDLVQHDYGRITDSGFEWYEGYGGENGYYSCDQNLVSLAYESAASVIGEDHVFKGTIATGDQFIASEEYVKILQNDFDAMACEMEGAAVADVCTQYQVPFVVIRTMSDKADGNAQESLENFQDLAADNSCRIVMEMLE